jgi:gluconate 5-dehydrogenase
MELFTSYIIKNKIKKSSLINLTSLNSEMAFSNNPGYVSTKGALKMLTKSFAIDYSKYGIRFNNIGPGYFLTDMTKKNFADKIKRQERLSRIPLGRYGHPKEIFGIIAYLLSDASSYVTGQDFYIDGGFLSKGI